MRNSAGACAAKVCWYAAAAWLWMSSECTTTWIESCGSSARGTEGVNGDNPSSDAVTEAMGVGDARALTDILPPDTCVGPYRILRLLGRGGMGSVYLAEQQSPVFRQVALKLIREQAGNPLARVWFEVERQALAQMQHPAIAQVYDAGATPDGTLFLAMELVDGVPITRFCREHRLDRSARLQLFRRVCLGVQHAHQKGVIHRDLKPDNVLVREVDSVPQPCIIDFGIAIGHVAAATSGRRDRAGTATYMSPEQASHARGDIDTRSDVYSLGVMLFEVLTDGDATEITGMTFHSGADVRSTLMQLDGIEETDGADAPATLLAAARELPRELRAVLARALARNRDDRYESAAALADDLERYTEKRPLVAMPASRGYALGKFVVRHRLGLSAVALAVLALVVGIVVALDAEQRARSAAVRAEQVSRFVGDILSGVDPDESAGMDTTLLRKLLDRAGQRVETELADEPLARAEIEGTIGRSYVSIGEYGIAGTYADRMLETAKDSRFDVEDRIRLLGTVTSLLNFSGDHERALEIGRQASTLSRRFALENPLRLNVERALAFAEWNSGLLESASHRIKAVYDMRVRAVRPDDYQLDEDMRLMVVLASETGDLVQSEKLGQQLLQRLHVRHGDNNSKTINAANMLGIVYLRQKRFADAEALLREWFPRAEALLGPDDPSTMNMYSNLGGAIRQQGRNEEARPYYEKAYAYNLTKYGEYSDYTLGSEANLAFLLRDAGDLAGAEAHARRCIDRMDKVLGGESGYRGAFPDLLGTILVKGQRYAEAEQAFLQAWALFENGSGFGATHPLAQETAQHLVDLYTAWNKPGQRDAWRAKLVQAGGDD